MNDDLLEKGLVEPTANVIRSPTIRLEAVLDEIEGLDEMLFDRRKGDSGAREAFSDVRQQARDASLFFLVQRCWNGPVEVPVKKLLASGLEPLLLEKEIVLFLPGVFATCFEGISKLLFDFCS